MKKDSPLVAQCLPSAFCELRSDAAVIDTIVIHSMYSPREKDPFCLEAAIASLDAHEVSCHYFIDRSGGIVQSVPERQKAWHAGESCLPLTQDKRSGVNDFSIGIELLGSENSGFTEGQYRALLVLIQDLCTRHPLQYVFGHADIAPSRKSDPWNFDWPRLRQSCAEQGLLTLRIRPGLA